MSPNTLAALTPVGSLDKRQGIHSCGIFRITFERYYRSDLVFLDFCVFYLYFMLRVLFFALVKMKTNYNTRCRSLNKINTCRIFHVSFFRAKDENGSGCCCEFRPGELVTTILKRDRKRSLVKVMDTGGEKVTELTSLFLLLLLPRKF